MICPHCGTHFSKDRGGFFSKHKTKCAQASQAAREHYKQHRLWPRDQRKKRSTCTTVQLDS